MGEYNKIIFIELSINKDSLIQNMNKKTFKNLIKKSLGDFIQPIDIWRWIWQENSFCSEYVNIRHYID